MHVHVCMYIRVCVSHSCHSLHPACPHFGVLTGHVHPYLGCGSGHGVGSDDLEATQEPRHPEEQPRAAGRDPYARGVPIFQVRQER